MQTEHHNPATELPSGEIIAPARGSRLRRALVGAAATALAAGTFTAPALAASSHHAHHGHHKRHHRHHGKPFPTGAAPSYKQTTLDDLADPTFNQLLGINNAGVIAGYFGSGATGHPNKGYTITSPYGQGNYHNENFPGSVQTQVTGLNNQGETVGFFVDGNGNNLGFTEHNGHFRTVRDPAAAPLAGGANGTPSVEQLLGVNDHNLAVGFYTDAHGKNHGFTYDLATNRFRAIKLHGLRNITPTAINNQGWIVGFDTVHNVPHGWLLKPNGTVKTIDHAQSGGTQPLGINNEDLVVGSYVDAQGNTHGFVWTADDGFTQIDAGNTTNTVINGINDQGQLVGFYTDAAGNTDGLLENPSSVTTTTPVTYSYLSLDDAADPTFNQLLGINNAGLIAGYFGSGATGHPNKGYTLAPPYAQANYSNENFPGSVQTQVTGLNNQGETVGFYADANGNNIGFTALNGVFTSVSNPAAPPAAAQPNAAPSIQQLLGVNDHNLAVGFYTDLAGFNHGFTYNLTSKTFAPVTPTGFTNITATAINDAGTLTGFGTTLNGQTISWVQSANGAVTQLGYPGATGTQALGISNLGEVVGSYTDGQGNTHGFTWTAKGGFTRIDDPNANGQTVVNGVNDQGQLVGFYLDRAGNTDGMLARPSQTP